MLEREDQLHSCLSQIIYDYKKEISSTAMKELEMEYKNTIYDILDFSNKLTDYFSNSIIQRYKFIFVCCQSDADCIESVSIESRKGQASLFGLVSV